ncbi:MAG: glutathione S-transferase family protein [Betaproteobacteria bacterium]|jgi:glutathione S-transferase|nr:glutathione S-transferase [Rubrivivax sp.]
MITVHHLENSRSQRVLWLLEELGTPYTVKRCARDPVTMLAPPELKAVHPLGKSPVIDDDGTVVAESGAIVEYLVDTHGGGRLKPPPGTTEARRYTYWLHFAEGSLMPPLLVALIFARVRGAKVPFFVKPIVKGIAAQVHKAYIDPNVNNLLAFMESELHQRDWFAGDDFTAADVQMSYPLEAAAAGRAGFTAQSHPRLHAWLMRCQARPAYQRALAAGGPYSVIP